VLVTFCMYYALCTPSMTNESRLTCATHILYLGVNHKVPECSIFPFFMRLITRKMQREQQKEKQTNLL